MESIHLIIDFTDVPGEIPLNSRFVLDVLIILSEILTVGVIHTRQCWVRDERSSITILNNLKSIFE